VGALRFVNPENDHAGGIRFCTGNCRRGSAGALVLSELDGMRARASVEPVDRDALPKLKRDPKSGEYRPG